MERGKALSTPLPPYVKLFLNNCPKLGVEKVEMAKVPYSSIVGSLMYAMICTLPDIAFVVGVVSSIHVKSWQETLGGSERSHEI